jgi:hypothetical protein
MMGPNPAFGMAQLLQAMAAQQQPQQAQGPSPIDLQGLFNPVGQAIEAQQPYQEPVPQAPNPFASMGSIFAGTLADMLGAHGAQANAQNRLAERQAMPQEAQQRNQERASQLFQEKARQRLQFREKVADAKYQEAIAARDYTEAQKQSDRAHSAAKELKQMDIDAEKVKVDKRLAGNLEVAKERGNQSRLTNAARTTLIQHIGQDPRAKLFLQQADDQAALVQARYNEMLKANAEARSRPVYENAEIPYNEAELEAARLDANDKMSKLYMDALQQLTSLGTSGPAVPPAAKPPIRDWLKYGK